MAAISALMLSESPLHRDPRDGNHSPATPHAPSRITSPNLNESTRYTISNEAIHLARPAPIQGTIHIDNKSPVMQPTTTREMIQDSSDIMELDDNQLEEDSDNDTEQGDATSGTRKKKGQRFFCTKYPPCNLSFTRSEHLARHIRKHTGERPFQCHCNRRFSRLDNLRQHAQTVHVNEEIPTDSLAATGTRFQRQIRTDRVRPTGRPRTSTMSSSGSHSRGHSRNLSASSIGSTSSSYSTSTIDLRRRPPPLIMAGDGRPKLGIDTPSTPPSQFASYSSHSPHDINTPTSATFSAVDGSPGFGSGIGSPLARGNSFSNSRAPARRLSVPSGTNPYQSPYGQPYAPPYNNPTNFPTGGMQPYPSAMVSPTNSTFSSYGPGPGFHVPPGEDWRRRTWHPSTYSGMNFNYQRPATSGLSYSQTPDAPQPAFAQHATAAAGHAPRLPGIESFDHVQQQHTTPPRQKLPSMTGSSGPPTLMPPVELESHAPRVQASTDTLRPIKHNESEESVSIDRRDSTDQMQLLDSQAKIRFAAATRHPMGPPPSAMTQQQIMQETPSLQSSNHRAKRNGWYNGPLNAARTSPEDSSSSEGVPTPGTSGVDIQPAIVHSNGIVEPHHAIVVVDGNNNNPCFPPSHGMSSYVDSNSQSRSIHHHRNSSGDLNRLEALVAVATNENNAPQGR